LGAARPGVPAEAVHERQGRSCARRPAGAGPGRRVAGDGRPARGHLRVARPGQLPSLSGRQPALPQARRAAIPERRRVGLEVAGRSTPRAGTCPPRSARPRSTCRGWR
jgi:hypothetical protein